MAAKTKASGSHFPLYARNPAGAVKAQNSSVATKAYP
jgi:hypothetical protein